ncbi:MAG TPA: GNAT family N-acetyltransferase [Flavihumibacter sp.]
MNISIRPIELGDNPVMAKIIRSALAEFGADKPGTVYYDESTDHLFELFQTPGSCYFVAQDGEEILGGAGIFPTEGLPPHWCELVKMYLRREARGLGIGRTLIAKSLEEAKKMGYKTVYLETMPELSKAVKVYEKFGFEYLCQPMGNSGHFGCDMWMKIDL